jgi:hypothetical protein
MAKTFPYTRGFFIENALRSFVAEGGDASAALRAVGLPEREEIDPGDVFSCEQYCELLHVMTNLLGDPYFPARAGQRSAREGMTAIVEARNGSKTIGEFLIRFQAIVRKSVTSGIYELHNDGVRAELSINRKLATKTPPTPIDTLNAAAFITMFSDELGTDPQAAWVARKRQRAMFAYDANYLIDNKVGVIMDAEGTCANRKDEIAVAETMVERVERRFGVKPNRLAGDTVYGAARLLRWLMDRGIEPHVPVWDKSRQPDGKFSRADFSFDKERNVYTCPNGAELTSTGNIDQGRIVYYMASTKDCSVCPVKQRCTTAINRKITRDIDQEVRDHVQSLANTPAFHHSSHERKKVEMAFAHMKRILKLDRLRLRGLEGARDEVLLTATAQNLRKLAKYVGHSPPNASICPA